MAFPPPTEKQARVFWISVTALSITVLLATIAVLFWGLGHVLSKLSPVLLPLALAAIIAYLLDPIVDWLETKRVPRVRAIFLVFILLTALAFLMLSTFVPRLIVEAEDLVSKAPVYAERIRERIENSAVKTKFLQFLERQGGQEAAPVKAADLNAKIFETASKIVPAIGAWIVSQVSRVAGWIGLVLGLLLVPVYAFYLLKEKMGIQKSWTDYLPIQESRLKEEMVFVLKEINDAMIVFFRGQVLVALCSGTLLTIGFFLIGINYALILGLTAGLFGIIPYLGVMISLIPALGLAFAQHGDLLHPALVILLFVLVNMAEGLLISPRIIGDRVGLHPLTVIVAVMVGTALMGGILGGVLAIPLTAALRAVMFRYIWKRDRVPRVAPSM